MYPPPPEYLAERRLLTRKLSFWRIAAFGALIAAVLVAALRLTGDRSHIGAHIARVTINGVISDDRDLLKVIRDVAASSSAGAAIVSINSPGGTTTGAEALYDELRQLAAKKPTVAVIDGVAASGGYIAALAADGIVARGNSIVGSIGVLMQMPNASKLMETVGVKMEEIKSSPLKAAPNPFEPVTPEARAAIAAMIGDSYSWFKSLVRDRRKLDDAGLSSVSDGRVFTGRQGVELRLVDRIGGEREAIAWLEAEKGVAKGLKVRDWKKPRKIETFGIFGALMNAAGLDRAAAVFDMADQAAQARLLDGLVAIWQGSALN